MMFSKNTKVMVLTPNEEIDFYDIVAKVLQRDTLAPYLFTICLDKHTSNVDQSNKRKWLYAKKGKKQMISCRNYK